MQFENFDKKIKEAADQYHPPYNDKAWKKMEKLLDENLPQKKDRRRRFFMLIFLFLLLGISTWILMEKMWKPKHGIADPEQLVENKPGKEDKFKQGNSDKIAKNYTPKDKISMEKNRNKTLKKNQVTVVDVNEKKYEISSKHKLKQNQTNNFPAIFKQKNIKTPNTNVFGIRVYNIEKKIFKSYEKGEVKENNPGEKMNEKVSLLFLQSAKIYESKKNGEYGNKFKENQITIYDSTPEGNPGELKNHNDNKQNPIINHSSAKKKKASGKFNTFFFTLSTGPDFSFVGSEGPGKLKLVGGIGIGYSLMEKFILRTGFYTTRKIYSARPSDYNAPPVFYTYYPNLEKIEADCRLYEIPLLISFSFSNTAKQNWFASTGLSSYLLNRETYNYFYKYTPASPTVSRKWTVPYKNNHFFSVLNFSAGFQRKIGKHYSLTIEPYMKIPINGVGYGKVKLNSGGVLFTININPFIK
jgi:hypothetical protein